MSSSRVGKLAIAVGILTGMMVLGTPALHAGPVVFLPEDYKTSVVGSKVTLTTMGGANGGGPFTMTGNFGSFVTFCLERNEYFVPGKAYIVDSIEQYAVKGGVGGQTANQDPISTETAYLYYSYVTTGGVSGSSLSGSALANA